jgi:hypothetical protein
MPALSTKTKHYYRERIRSILVQSPQVSGEGIRIHLQQQGLTLDRHYIGKLVGEIHTERAKRANTFTASTRATACRAASWLSVQSSSVTTSTARCSCSGESGGACLIEPNYHLPPIGAI